MTEITFNDSIGSRNRRHINLIVAQVGDNQLITEFTGEDIPGAVTILKKEYTKSGKWSHNKWTLDIKKVGAFVWGQDFETGAYVNGQTWDIAKEEIKGMARRNKKTESVELNDEAIERFIRFKWPKMASELDKNEEKKEGDPTPYFEELLRAQEELAEAQKAKEEAEKEKNQLLSEVKEAEQAKVEAEKVRQEAEKTQKQVSSAKEAMRSGASLADLKELLS